MNEKTALVTDGRVICQTFENRYDWWDHSTAFIRADGALDCTDGGIVPLPAGSSRTSEVGANVIRELGEKHGMFPLASPQPPRRQPRRRPNRGT